MGRCTGDARTPAARALGLDCGPMSGFLHDVVDAEFFGGTKVRSNFLINIGYGSDLSIRDAANGSFDANSACNAAGPSAAARVSKIGRAHV